MDGMLERVDLSREIESTGKRMRELNTIVVKIIQALDKHTAIDGKDSMDGSKAIASLKKGWEDTRKEQSPVWQQHKDAVKRLEALDNEWEKKYLNHSK